MNESLVDIQLFVAIADGANLAQSANNLGITPAGASAALKRLETQLGVKLVIRSTRKFRLSDEGERYLPHARDMLAARMAGRTAVSASDGELDGWVRISAPADLGRNALMHKLRRFAQWHPKVRFQLMAEDALSDFYSTPVDLALRYGRLDDSRLIAIALRELPRIACAAPSYLDQFGEPQHPHALAEHATIAYMIQQRATTRWRFSRNDESVEVVVRPRWVLNDAEMVRRCAVDGMGIAYRIRSDVQADLDAGRLRVVLHEWTGEQVTLSLVYTDRRLNPCCALSSIF